MQTSRRAVLRGLLGTAGAVALEACGARSRTTGASSASPSAAPSPAAWDTLRHRLSGTLLLRGEPGFTAASQLFNRRFDAIVPAAVVSARSVTDVQAAVRFARDHGLPVTARSGGHSYVGASTNRGLVVDLRPMSAITVQGTSCGIGTGAALVDAYAQLAARGVFVPGGSCPTVGLSGLTLGGGLGVLSRQYGLTCDHLASAQVVLADGQVVTASGDSHPDLLWALRGAGAGFGIVTSMGFRTEPTTGLSTSYHAFPWEAAATVLGAWMAHLPAAPRSVWSTCHLLATADGSGPTVSVSCVRIGSSGGLTAVLAPFLAAAGAAPTTATVRDRSFLGTMLLEAGCADSTVAACHVAGQSPAGTLPRDAFVAASDLFTAPVPPGAVDALAGAVEARQRDRSLGVGGAAFDTWGGAVGDVAPDGTAFVHRDVAFGAQYTASWASTPGTGPQAANQASLDAIKATVAGAATGAAYQNYADPTLTDAAAAYYGANLARLRRVKSAYDPDGVFHAPGGISPA
ncbi:MAG TPA: FAD-binding oxidoreductase [Mycobacteriales bacterium]